ncbi:MAG: methyltransferase family protein [Burkholderiales bacterium]
MLLVAIYGLSELLIVLYKRSGSSSTSRDNGSLEILVRVIFCSVGIALIMKITFPQAQSDILLQLTPIGAGIFAFGLILRWSSIIYLGQFFTIDVAIAEDHKVIDTGPYRHIRHPSYTGALMLWLGMGICSGNLLTLPIILLPPAIALLHRIAIEETVLSDALGNHYTDYMRKTTRLIPYVY